jgi:hypothetical protein
MEDQDHNFAARDSASFRSFAVEAFVGRRASGWPFARFDVSSGELRVRLSFPWFTTRLQQATAVRAVVVTRRFGDMWWIRFDDGGNSLSNVHIRPIYHREQMIDELRRCEYLVVGDTVRAASRWRWERS